MVKDTHRDALQSLLKPIPNLHASSAFYKTANKKLKVFSQVLSASVWNITTKRPSQTATDNFALHASHKQSASHKLIKFNHTTLKRKTARHMLFHLISPSPYTIRNLLQLLQQTDFCVKKHWRGKKRHF